MNADRPPRADTAPVVLLAALFVDDPDAPERGLQLWVWGDRNRRLWTTRFDEVGQCLEAIISDGPLLDQRASPDAWGAVSVTSPRLLHEVVAAFHRRAQKSKPGLPRKQWGCIATEIVMQVYGSWADEKVRELPSGCLAESSNHRPLPIWVDRRGTP